jgi:hypothetical protein
MNLREKTAPKLMTYGPDHSNIGAFLRDRKGHVFEVIDETPDGRFVVVQDGFGDSQIDLDSALARCEGCDEPIRRQGTRYVHLAPPATGGAHDHPASPAPEPIRQEGPVEVYLGRQLLETCYGGTSEAVELVRATHPGMAVTVDERRVVVRLPRSQVEYIYDLLYVSTRKGAAV